jgi:hypothetical protein
MRGAMGCSILMHCRVDGIKFDFHKILFRCAWLLVIGNTLCEGGRHSRVAIRAMQEKGFVASSDSTELQNLSKPVP